MIRNPFAGAILPGILALLFASPAAAQSETGQPETGQPETGQSEPDEAAFVAAFAGDWLVHDDIYRTGEQPCAITLGAGEEADGYGIQTAGCGLELSELTGWRIVEGQLVLFAEALPVVALGGSQNRISGASNIGAPVILDRAGVVGPGDRISAAREASGCYYLGFTDTCVDDAQLAKPELPGDGSGARIGILVNLNARIEARDDAAVLGVVPANSCIVTEVCASASDGVWCRARFGEESGWLKKLALRQDRWPVVTYVNQCAE